METPSKALDALLPEDRRQLSELYQQILEPLIYCLIRKGKKEGFNDTAIIVPQGTLAKQAGCSRWSANMACKRARELGIITWQWVKKNKGPNPGYWSANCYMFGPKYRKLFSAENPRPASGRVTHEDFKDFRKKMGWESKEETTPEPTA